MPVPRAYTRRVDCMRNLARRILAVSFLLLPPAAGHAQASLESLEHELVGRWLLVLDGQLRSRTLEIRELAKRADGSLMIDAKFGWTIGGVQSPVVAELAPQDSTFCRSTPRPAA